MYSKGGRPRETPGDPGTAPNYPPRISASYHQLMTKTSSTHDRILPNLFRNTIKNPTRIQLGYHQNITSTSTEHRHHITNTSPNHHQRMTNTLPTHSQNITLTSLEYRHHLNIARISVAITRHQAHTVTSPPYHQHIARAYLYAAFLAKSFQLIGQLATEPPSHPAILTCPAAPG